MSAILWRIREVGIQNKISMTEYERGGGGTQSSPPPNRNVQDSERYAIHIFGTKNKKTVYAPLMMMSL